MQHGSSIAISIPFDKTLAYSTNVGSPKYDGWQDIFVKFTSAFTFYGFLVLSVVGLWRIGRAMLDQSERLRDRRHALRQGRLYVHLNDGVLNPDELEKAFAWNKESDNAFSKIPTEASAPWGSLFKDAFKAVADTFKREKTGLKG